MANGRYLAALLQSQFSLIRRRFRFRGFRVAETTLIRSQLPAQKAAFAYSFFTQCPEVCING
jgi:hypothetical protein